MHARMSLASSNGRIPPRNAGAHQGRGGDNDASTTRDRSARAFDAVAEVWTLRSPSLIAILSFP